MVVRKEQVSDKTGITYQGENQLLLTQKSNEEGYEDNRWGTFRWWSNKGRIINKGERGVRCYHPSVINVTDSNGDEIVEDGRVKTRNIRKFFTLFNIEQTTLREYVISEYGI